MKKKNKHLRSLICTVIVIAILVGGLFAALGIESLIVPSRAEELTAEEAHKIITDELSALPKKISGASLALAERIEVTVKEIEYGDERDVRVLCSYKTVDFLSVIEENINGLLNVRLEDPSTGRPKSSVEFMLEIEPKMIALVDTAATVEGEVEVTLYQSLEGEYKLEPSDKTVNALFGNVLKARDLVKKTEKIDVNGTEVDIKAENSLRDGCADCFALVNYDSAALGIKGPVHGFVDDFKSEFYNNFIKDSRWMYLVKGLGTTLAITALALVLGLIIGFIVAAVRCTNAKTGKLGILDAICKVYLAVMRGTPVMVQLLIIYFVILLPLGIPKFLAAVLCFGINSGAYVSEIVRGGIMSIDEGQTEAGRSLGLGYVATMWYIVIPQAFKAILPSLANEFITLLKETSVAFYIGVADLTLGGLKIRSLTYSDFMPLLAVAVIYLILVLGLSYLVSLLERRLRKSER